MGVAYEIVEVLRFPTERRTRRLLFFKDNSVYLEWLRKFFDSAESPYILEGNIALAALALGNFSLPDADLEKINLNYLNEYCDSHKNFNNEVMMIWRNCMPSEEARNYTSRTSKEADEIFGKYLKNTISASELGRFIRQVNPDVEFFRISDEEWKFFFSSFEDFMEWIDNAPNLAKPAEDKAEMLDFLNKIRINQFNAVEYTFRKLKPIRWIRGNRSL